LKENSDMEPKIIAPQPQKQMPVTILDWRDDSGISDRLFIDSDRNINGCTHSRCSGSKVKD